MEHICAQCGNVFERSNRNAKYCTRRCYELSKRKLSVKQESVIVARYIKGESSISIGEDIGVSHSLILDTVHRAGIKTRKNTAYRQYSLREDAFDQISDRETAYWLGFLYADGYVREDGVTVRLKPGDKEHIQKFLDFMGSDAPVKYTKSYAGDTVLSSCHSYYLASQLARLGIIPGRTEFEKTVNAIPPHLYRAFIRGLIDGDGYITNPNTKYTANIGFCGQKDVVMWMRNILVKSAKASPKPKPRKRKHAQAWEISFGGRFQVKRIVNWLYKDAPVYLTRKQQRAEYWGATQ